MISVLIVEDDPMVAEINKTFLEKIADCHLVGIAKNATECLHILNTASVDLLLLDIYMPNKTGLELLKEIRQNNMATDIIMISAATDAKSINEALRYGVSDYIIKPFSFERFQEALERYGKRSQILNSNTLSQQDLDALIASKKNTPAAVRPVLPKGIDAQTLQQILFALETIDVYFHANELATKLNISRVSIKKYLDYLYEIQVLDKKYTYGTKGRPLNNYIKIPNKFDELYHLYQ